MQTRRQEILSILKKEGEATVDELAETLELTPVTVRHHLDILRAENLVEASAIRRSRGPGRPQYVYTLTEQAAEHFPQNYDVLVNELLEEMKDKLDQQTIRRILDSIADRRLEHAPLLDPDSPLEERLDALVQFMCEWGHIASWVRNEDGWFVHASNCPYYHVASEHPELCAFDKYIWEHLVGTEVRCQQRIINGAHTCIYQIIPLRKE